MELFKRQIDEDQKQKAEKYTGYDLQAFDSSQKVVNFSPGPTCLPRPVYDSIVADLNDQQKWAPGVSPLELSHRSPEFSEIKFECEKLFRKLYQIPDDFALLWTHGGGHGCFSMVPMNLITEQHQSASYIVNGAWSRKAMNEASKYIKVNEISNEQGTTPTIEQRASKWDLENCAYVYLCSNETVAGLEFRDFENAIQYPSREELNGVPLVVDMGSDVLSKKVNWDNIDVAFACCPKNFGISGATITIIRQNMLDLERKYDMFIPTLFRWRTLVDSDNMYNTLPTFNIYVCKKVLEWMDTVGGIEAMEQRAKQRSKIIYDTIDNSNGFFIPGVPSCNPFRSRMNIPFTLKDDSLNELFLLEGFKRNIVGLKTKTPFGPGDIRMSLYNAIEVEDSQHLAKFMKEFAQQHSL